MLQVSLTSAPKELQRLLLARKFNEAYAWVYSRVGEYVGDTVMVSFVKREAAALGVVMSAEDTEAFFLDNCEEFRSNQANFRLA